MLLHDTHVLSRSFYQSYGCFHAYYFQNPRLGVFLVVIPVRACLAGFYSVSDANYPLSNTTRKEIRIRHTERGYVCVSYLIRPRRVRLEMNARGQKSKSCNRVGRSVLISRVRVVFKAAAAGYSSDRRRFDIVN